MRLKLQFLHYDWEEQSLSRETWLLESTSDGNVLSECVSLTIVFVSWLEYILRFVFRICEDSDRILSLAGMLIVIDCSIVSRREKINQMKPLTYCVQMEHQFCLTIHIMGILDVERQPDFPRHSWRVLERGSRGWLHLPSWVYRAGVDPGTNRPDSPAIGVMIVRFENPWVGKETGSLRVGLL